MLALPCCRRGGSVEWDGEGAEGVSATRSRSSPLRRQLQCEGGGAYAEHVRY